MIKPVTKEEIIQALNDLPADKAPEGDGFPVEFFKANWDVVGDDVITTILQFFETGKILKEINNTTITLVPKVPNPTHVKEFRPIACCTTLYKLIAKVITVRLKQVVDKIVGPAQSAFIEGRNILDNVIVAHELVKCYNRKGTSLRCLVKVDIRKAYDTIE